MVTLDKDSIIAIKKIEKAIDKDKYNIDRFEIDTNGLGEQFIEIRIRKLKEKKSWKIKYLLVLTL